MLRYMLWVHYVEGGFHVIIFDFKVLFMITSSREELLDVFTRGNLTSSLEILGWSNPENRVKSSGKSRAFGDVAGRQKEQERRSREKGQ